VKRALFALAGLFAAGASAQDPTDLLTLNCLIGYENDHHPRVCAIVDPPMKDKVAAARKAWEARNGTNLLELNKACEARLKRAYGNDRAKIGQAKRAAQQWKAAHIDEELERPDRHNIVNCFAYAADFAAGASRIDIQQWLIDETRDSPARPVELPRRR
jgi:hypothetical protein